MEDAWKRTERSGVRATPGNSAFGVPLDPNEWSWLRVSLWEIRSFYQRMRFARERHSAPRHIDLDLLCQTCAAAGDRYCYENVSRCMLHIEKLRSAYPWIGWADMALFVQTWSEALDTACCNLDSAKTLRKYRESLASTGANAITEEGK